LAVLALADEIDAVAFRWETGGTKFLREDEP
jgi:hypothetical protein